MENEVENKKDIDAYFAATGLNKTGNQKKQDKRARLIKLIEIAFPSLAAVLLGLLILMPSLKETKDTVKLDITLPKKSELEKLHMEQSDLTITDKSNKVNHFMADNLDETAPGSKVVKLTNPRGNIPSGEKDSYDIRAPVGYYNQNTNTLTLEQNAVLKYSAGMTAKTEKLSYNFGKNYGESTTPTHGEGYLGTLDSQGFKFYKDQNLMIFTGKTHIVIDEKQLKG